MDDGRSHLKPFPTTQWSLIVRAASDDPSDRDRAISEICTLYWPPVYAYFRTRGNSPTDAEDLAQGLFATLLERNDFAKADPSLGTLRSYLLTAAKNHAAGERRREHRQKRGGAHEILSWDAGIAESRCLIPEPADALTPEKAFHRQWAITLMENVVDELAAAYAAKGRAELFTSLRLFIQTDLQPTPQRELAASLQMTESALRVAVHRLRQRYADTLRHTVRTTLGPGDNIDEEIAALLSAF